jgi:urea carboxylase
MRSTFANTHTHSLAMEVGYLSAGTVEFLYEAASESYFFLEVNTRLQVEHGVTEECTGLDIVEWMIRAAAGVLDLSTFVPTFQGHSIQVRLYAEDPNKGFLPCNGVITRAAFSPIARNETFIVTGATVSPFYDPLLAKIIVHAPTREEARQKMMTALADTCIAGVECNLEYLRQLVASPVFASGTMYTQYLNGSFVYQPYTIDVIDGGAATTVQDYPGRIGHWAAGVSPSGPMDAYAHRVANRLVGNPTDAAALEIAMSGPTLKFNVPSLIALCGAPFVLHVNGVATATWQAVWVPAGALVRVFMPPQARVKGGGCRATLAIRGGIDVPVYLGSRSTFTLGNFGGHGGRKLLPGDVLPLPRDRHVVPEFPQEESVPAHVLAVAPPAMVPAFGQATWQIRVMCGPHAAPDFLLPQYMEEFLAAKWTVHYNSNRMGIRLTDGPTPKFTREDGGEAGLHPSNIHDTVYAIGSINLSGEMPIILTADGPSLGGFICPVTIIQADLWKAGQVSPGDAIQFVLVNAEMALAAEQALDTTIDTLTPSAMFWLPAALLRLDAELSASPFPAVSVDQTSPIVHTMVGSPSVVYRQAGDKNLLIEYGELVLDLALRLRVHALMTALKAQPLAGLEELSPGVRSLQVRYDNRRLSQAKLIAHLADIERALPPTDQLEVPSRILRLPLAWNASTTKAAIAKYQQSVREVAPWLPSNIEFIRRINGLSSVDDVESICFRASYIVLGLGDVYLGAPCAVPLDPRHRLVTTKYNPARTYTAEGEVAIGGVYMCIYGMDSPGGLRPFFFSCSFLFILQSSFYLKFSNLVITHDDAGS